MKQIKTNYHLKYERGNYEVSDMEGQDNCKNIEYIAENVEKNTIDILCVQEIVTSGSSINFIAELQKKLSFKYSSFYELSSAHIDDNTMMGVAILSRYCIAETYKIKLTNPQIVFNKNGKSIRSDDKGFLVTEIIYKGKKVKKKSLQDQEAHPRSVELAPTFVFYTSIYYKKSDELLKFL